MLLTEHLPSPAAVLLPLVLCFFLLSLICHTPIGAGWGERVSGKRGVGASQHWHEAPQNCTHLLRSRFFNVSCFCPRTSPGHSKSWSLLKASKPQPWNDIWQREVLQQAEKPYLVYFSNFFCSFGGYHDQCVFPALRWSCAFPGIDLPCLRWKQTQIKFKLFVQHLSYAIGHHRLGKVTSCSTGGIYWHVWANITLPGIQHSSG